MTVPLPAQGDTDWIDWANQVHTETTRLSPRFGVITLTYGASITPNAATGVHFRLSATGSPTINLPSGGVDGQRLLFEITASGGARTVTFAAGYELGEAVTSRTVNIASGLTAYVGVINRGDTYRLLAVDDGTA